MCFESESSSNCKYQADEEGSLERLAVLLKVTPPKEYLEAQEYLEDNYEAYHGHAACDHQYEAHVAHKSVSGQNPHVTLMWDLHTTKGCDDAVMRLRRAYATFSSENKVTDIALNPAPEAKGEFTACDNVEVHDGQGWAFGHCATPEYPTMTWMEVTLAPSQRFSELKRCIMGEFGETVSDEFQPHCSLLYFPHKDPSFTLAEAHSLVERYPKMVSTNSVYQGLEICWLRQGSMRRR